MSKLTMTNIMSQMHDNHIKTTHNKAAFNPIKQYCSMLNAGQRKPRGYQ